MTTTCPTCVGAAYGTDGDHNYCRNPTGAGEIFCYYLSGSFLSQDWCDPLPT